MRPLTPTVVPPQAEDDAGAPHRPLGGRALLRGEEAQRPGGRGGAPQPGGERPVAGERWPARPQGRAQTQRRTSQPILPPS